MIKLTELVKYLNDNQFGIYYKQDAISKLPIANGEPLYKVNRVSDSHLGKTLEEHNGEE